MGPIDIKVDRTARRHGVPKISKLKKALSGMAGIYNIKCFSFDTEGDVLEDSLWAAVGAFQEWFTRKNITT